MEIAYQRSLTGKMPQELENAPSMPAGFDYLWEWFSRLNSTRPKGMGISGIAESEIRSFFLNRHIEPEPWEVRIIEKLDYIALEYAAKNQDQDT